MPIPPTAPRPPRRQVIVYGYYGCRNLGDDLLLAVTIEGLRQVFPESGFLVRDHGGAEGLERLGGDVAFTGIETLLAERGRGGWGRAPAYFAAWLRLLGRSRWLIFGGGTLFHARGSLRMLEVIGVICLLARLRGVRIAALGVGVSELPPAARWLLRRIIGMSELFLVRDEAALAQCRGTRARLTADLVFAWKGLDAAAAQCARSGALPGGIALTVYAPAFDGPAGARLQRELRQAVALLAGRGRRVVFLVCQRPGIVVGDEAIFTAMEPEGQRIERRAPACDAASIVAQFADIGVVCGMRFHALVLAARLGLPFVGLAHDNKISEICARFSMPSLDPAAMTAEALVAALDQAAMRRPDPALLAQSAEAAAENFRLLARNAEGSGLTP